MIQQHLLQPHSARAGYVFPTKDHPKEQLQMFLNVRAMLGKFNENDCNLVIGGDFNICQDPLVDKVGGINVPKNKVNSELELLKEDLNLIDVWRTLHPNSKIYTHR